MAAICADSPEGAGRFTGLRTSAQAYTICFDIDIPALPAAYSTFLYQGDDPAIYSGYIWIGLWSDGLCEIDVNGTRMSNPIPRLGKLHVAYVRAGVADHKLYLEARPHVFSGGSAAAVTIDHQLLGTDRNAAGWHACKLSRVREWSVALTNAEIVLERLSPTVVKTASLICDAPFATDLLDDSGVGNDWLDDGGTLTFEASSGLPTRFYPAVKAIPADVDGYAAGTWNYGPTPQSYRREGYRVLLSTSKSDAGSQSAQSISCDRQPNYDISSGIAWMSWPLEAQTIEGVFDLCMRVQARWVGTAGFTNDSIVRYKVHVFITQGQTGLVRHTLLDNYVDTVNFPGTSGGVWRALVASQALTPGNALDGDCIGIEFGFRIVSAPTPTVTYPPDEWTQIDWRAVGASVANADAIPGDTSTSRAPWFEFSHPFTFKPLSAAPVLGTTCATPIPIAAFPYASSFIDTTQAPGTEREMWAEFTAPTSGEIFVTTLGSTYRTSIDIYRGTCGAPVLADYGTRIYFWGNRSGTVSLLNATAGVTYRVRIRNSANISCASNSGGRLRITAFYRQEPQEDDLYAPVGHLVAFREGVPVNINPTLDDLSPQGVSIDYTERAMVNAGSAIGGDPHTRHRIHVSLFYAPNLAEILDLPTLNYVVAGASDIDVIQDPWNLTVPLPSSSRCAICQLHIRRNTGILTATWQGNGFLYVAGQGSNIPASMNASASDPDFSAIKTIDCINGDNQPAAPFADVMQYPTIEGVGSNLQGDVDETTNVLYYASSTNWGVEGTTNATQVRTFNLTTGVQGPVFCTFTPLGSGYGGLYRIPGAGILLANGPVIQRYNEAGALIGTYTPSTPSGDRQMTDIQVTADGLSAWTMDVWSARLYKFTIATMLEVATYPTYLRTARTYQLALYQPDGVVVPPPEEEVCITAPEPIGCWNPGVPSVSCAAAHTPTKGEAWEPTHDPDAATVSLKDHH